LTKEKSFAIVKESQVIEPKPVRQRGQHQEAKAEGCQAGRRTGEVRLLGAFCF
jgi:hypothetical protein